MLQFKLYAFMGQFFPPYSVLLLYLRLMRNMGDVLFPFFYFFTVSWVIYFFCNSKGEDDFLNYILSPVHANAIIKQQVPARRLNNQCYSWNILEMWFLMSVTVVSLFSLAWVRESIQEKSASWYQSCAVILSSWQISLSPYFLLLSR